MEDLENKLEREGWVKTYGDLVVKDTRTGQSESYGTATRYVKAEGGSVVTYRPDTGVMSSFSKDKDVTVGK